VARSLRAIAGRILEQQSLEELLSSQVWSVLVGSPGSGKTTLVNWLCERAREQGVNVLLLRPVEIETSIAFSALSDLVSRVGEDSLAALDGTHRAVFESLLSAIPIEDPTVVRAAFTALLHALAESGPLLMVLDDAQWIDRQSAEAIAFACRRALRSHPLLAAFRTKERSLLLDALVSDSACSVITLDRLSDADLAVIIGEEAPALTPSLQMALAVFAHGNPLRAREVGRASRRGREAFFTQHDIEVEANPLTSAAELLDEHHLEVLYVASQMRNATESLLNTVFAPELVCQALNVAADASHLLIVNQRIEFEHPLLGDAVASLLTHQRRRELHGRIAECVTDPIERGRHLSLSATSFDQATRISIFVASTLAATAGSMALALQLAYRAIDGVEVPDLSVSSPMGQMYIDVQRWVSNLEFRVDDPEAAARRLNRLAEQLSGTPQRIRVEIDLANLLAWSTSLSSGIGMYEDILSKADASDAEIAETCMQLAVLHVNTRTASQAVIVSGRGRLAGFEAGGQVEAESLSAEVFSRFLAGHGLDVESLDRAMALEHQDNWLSVQCAPFSLRPFLFGWCDDDRVFEACETRRAIFRRRGSTTALVMGIPFEVNMLLRRGRTTQARELVQFGVDSAEFENELTRSCSQLAEGRLYAHLGMWQQAENSLKAADETFERIEFRQGAIESANVRASLLAATGESAALVAFGSKWMRLLDQFEMTEPMLIPGVLDLIEVAAGTHNVELLSALQRRLAAAVDADRPDIVSARLWAEALSLSANRDDASLATGLFEELAATWIDSGRVLWGARAKLALGRHVRRDGSRRAAADHFAVALDLFESAEANGWRGNTRAEIARLGGSAGGTGALTAVEAGVARHASDGLSNKEIAMLMFISDKTVESHLSSIYRKLGIKRRAQIAAKLTSSE
jgi:DNA-binding CsgD family transcriptional regulator